MSKKILFAGSLIALAFAAAPFFASAACPFSGGDMMRGGDMMMQGGCQGGCMQNFQGPNMGPEMGMMMPGCDSQCGQQCDDQFSQCSFDQTDCNQGGCDQGGCEQGGCQQCQCNCDNNETGPIIGTVSSVSGNTVNVLSDEKTYAVDASDASIIRSAKEADVADIKNGDRVIVKGEVDGTNVKAELIFDSAKDDTTPPPSPVVENTKARGTITSINGSSFTIQYYKNGQSTTNTINTNSSTVFTKESRPAVIGDLYVNAMVMVSGTKETGSSTISATKVNIVLPTTKLIIPNGTVNAISGNTITVTDNSGIVYTVDATNAAFYFKTGAATTLSTVQVGDKVSVKGSLPSNAVNVLAVSIKDLSR